MMFLAVILFALHVSSCCVRKFAEESSIVMTTLRPEDLRSVEMLCFSQDCFIHYPSIATPSLQSLLAGMPLRLH